MSQGLCHRESKGKGADRNDDTRWADRPHGRADAIVRQRNRLRLGARGTVRLVNARINAWRPMADYLREHRTLSIASEARMPHPPPWAGVPMLARTVSLRSAPLRVQRNTVYPRRHGACRLRR